MVQMLPEKVLDCPIHTPNVSSEATAGSVGIMLLSIYIYLLFFGMFLLH